MQQYFSNLSAANLLAPLEVQTLSFAIRILMINSLGGIILACIRP